MMLNKLSLNTIGLNRIGLNRIGKPSRGSSGRPYIDPEVLSALKAVCICYGKSNDDPDRAIVKNLVDPDNPFIISNAAYKLNSGYGKYEEDFTSWDRIDASTAEISNDGSKIKCINTILNVQYLFNSINKDIPSFKVKISNFTKGNIAYYYRKEDGTEAFLRIEPSPLDKVLELPKSYNTVEGGTGSRGGFYSSNINIGVTIEQIPSYQGAFVTDRVDDLITSTKTVQEMGITKACTVISMIHHIDVPSDASFNNIRNSTAVSGRNGVYASGTTGIYGWSKDNVSGTNTTLINNILGDKNNYTNGGGGSAQVDNMKFSVQGFISDSGVISETSQVAWYWTIIANKVLTTDQINQVIAYYNLDRCVEPTVLYDVKRQGLSNDTPDSDWYLKDFSKNGFDMSLFNFAKDGDSGIGKYNYPNWKINVTQGNKYARIVYYDSINGTYSANFKGVTGLYKSYGLSIEIKVNRVSTIDFHSIKEDGIYTMTPPDDTTSIDIRFGGENVYNASCDITITQIPSHAGALCFDGVEDYGKAIGLPAYKDYTFVIDYQRLDKNLNNLGSSSVLSKSPTGGQGAFLSNHWNNLGTINHCYSFGEDNIVAVDDSERKIYYQSKYSNQGISINAGSGTDGSNMWLGIIRDNDTRLFNGAIYSLMTFPYSMSEFLIERQLKKHKLGTLYPDMVEFRPVIKTNVDYTLIQFYINAYTKHIYPGDYIPINTPIEVNFYLKNNVDELISFKINGNDSKFKKSTVVDNAYNIRTIPITKSPQKIDITIDEYIRYEDIVQPYPAIVTLKQDGKDITWGDKLKVGDEVTFVTHTNLLPNLYTVSGAMYYNGKFMYGNTPITVAKSMTFTTVHNYIKSNEPKCILSPSRLRIPNSSYKILGYIPDISGHGNHGKINNSAYAGVSGANGYTEKTFSEWSTSNKNAELSLANDVKLRITKVTKANLSVIYNQISYYSTDTIQRYKVTGVNESHPIIFGNDMPVNSLLTVTQDGEYEVDWKTYGKNPCIFTNWTGDCNITIEQVGEYEGAYCLDGVDDFITIPTTVGGKQVIMKVIWDDVIADAILYDQRGYPNEFAIYNADNDNSGNPVTAYQARNNGKTYIDGILNSNIKASELKNVNHIITITNELSSGANNSFSVIGSNRVNDAYFTKMALYDFLLFDEISTDEEILTLNEYIGIEPKVTLPPYYWDAYGKSNTDEDKATIQQRGVAVGDYDLTNNNLAYEGMSGYNGYPVVFGENKTWATLSGSSSYTSNVTNNIINVTHVERAGNGLIYSYVKQNEALVNIKEIPSFKISIKGLEEGKKLLYRYLSTEDATATTITPFTNGVHVLPKSFAPSESLLENPNNVFIGFSINSDDGITTSFDCDITIEVLPEYPNGLVLDGVNDHLINENIPAFTDFTVIAKREHIGDFVSSSSFCTKGNVFVGATGDAFIMEYIGNNNFSNFIFGQTNIISSIHEGKVSYLTPTNYNGLTIVKGTENDNAGVTIGKHLSYWKGVFYKLMLYPKTITNLEIMFLKNMFERDEIIDLTNPIFIQE